MNRATWLCAVAGAALGLQAALGQSLVNQVERTQPPAAPAAAPGGGYLGYTPVEGTDESRGIPVESVKPGAPAAQGGLKDGDLITAVNGRRMTLAEFDDFLRTASPGQRLQLTVDRGGRTQQLIVTLGSRAASSTPSAPSPPESSFASPSLTPPASSSPTGPPPTGSFSAPRTPADPAPPPSLTAPASPIVPDAAAPSLTPPSSSEPLPGSGSTAQQGTEAQPRSIQAEPLDLGPPPGAAPDADPSADRPGSPAAGGGSGGASLGITVVPLTEDARAQAGIPVRRGAMVANVRRGSPAEQAGLPVGGVIVRMDSREISSPDDLVAAVRASQPGQQVEVTYYDRNRLYRKVVVLAGAGGASEPLAGEAGRVGPAPSPPGGGATFGGEGPLRGAPGPLGNRPMLRNLGQMAADALSRPPATSTVYDPSVVAALQSQVVELTELTKQLEERIRSLESKLGEGQTGAGHVPSSAPPVSIPPASAPPAAPSFGGPSGPGFGPALGGNVTTP